MKHSRDLENRQLVNERSNWSRGPPPNVKESWEYTACHPVRYHTKVRQDPRAFSTPIIHSPSRLFYRRDTHDVRRDHQSWRAYAAEFRRADCQTFKALETRQGAQSSG